MPSPDLFRRGGSSRKTAANRRVRMQPTAPAVGGTGRSRPAPAGETSALSGSGACWFDQNPDGLDDRQCRVIVLGKLSNLAQNRWRRCVIVGQSKMRNRGAPESSGVLEIWLRLPSQHRRAVPTSDPVFLVPTASHRAAGQPRTRGRKNKEIAVAERHDRACHEELCAGPVQHFGLLQSSGNRSVVREEPQRTGSPLIKSFFPSRSLR